MAVRKNSLSQQEKRVIEFSIGTSTWLRFVKQVELAHTIITEVAKANRGDDFNISLERGCELGTSYVIKKHKCFMKTAISTLAEYEFIHFCILEKCHDGSHGRRCGANVAVIGLAHNHAFMHARGFGRVQRLARNCLNCHDDRNTKT